MNPREQAIRRLEKELTKAARSQKFVKSEEGCFVLEYIAELISQLTNKVLNKRLETEEYIEVRAKIDILRKLKAVLEAQANEEHINSIREQLDLAQSGD
jgi:hypothetical protein